MNSSNGDRTPSSGQQLLAEFIQYGRQRPFEEIVRRYAGMVYTVCLRVTKDKHDAEDSTQAVFLTLALHAKKQGNEIKALGPWLQQVAKRLALDLRRSKGRRKNREFRHHDEQEIRRASSNGHSLPPADMDEIKAILHDELQKLPSKYRLPLVLHYFGGLNRDEMAAELGCKPSTLGVRIFRGRAMLAGRLTGRGVNFTPSMLPLALGYTIKSAVSQAMVLSTSHAATAVAAGHDLIGLVSARVIGLTRKAAGAAMIGKLKFAAAVLVLALTTLGAGARAFGMLPKINIGQIITDQIHKLIQPLLGPVSIHLQASAAPTNSSNGVQPPVQYAIASSILPPRVPATVRPSAWSGMTATPLAAVGVAPPSLAVPMNIKINAAVPVPTVALAAPSAHITNSSDVSATPAVVTDTSATASGASASDSANDSSSISKATDAAGGKPIFAAADGASAGGSGGAGGGGGAGGSGGAMAMFATPANSIYLPPPTSSSAGATVVYIPSGNGTKTILMSSSKSNASKSTVIRIPTSSGLVTESNGVLSGWGTVPGTGTLDINGNKVVADGDGVDRTLNMSTYSITDVATNTPSQTAGFYATNHGRLTLSLQPAKSGGALVWGEDPANATLDLVNSVRLKPLPSVSSSDGSEPTELSLVSPDRQDLPSLSGINGQPIGIWQVDSSTDSTGEIACADLTVHYDASLAASLGADNTDVRLWTYGSSAWAPAVASSADTTDDLITGVASNFNYFAVTVPEPTAAVVSEFAALPSEQIIPADSQTVPEPVGLGLLATGALLLGRRRARR